MQDIGVSGGRVSRCFEMSRVLVLRPQPGGDQTAATLRSLGYEAIMFPIGRIEPLAPQIDIDPSMFAAVAATSINGLRHTSTDLVDGLVHLPLFAVGSATGDAARHAGFRTVIEGQTDGAELARLIVDRRPSGAILYLCGRLRRPEFEAALSVAGIDVVAVETYLASYPDLSTEFADLVANGGLPETVLIHSPEAGKAFSRLVENTGIDVRNVRIIAISARAGLPFAESGCQVVIADQPNESGMIAALTR